jgi:hypothetical protein
MRLRVMAVAEEARLRAESEILQQNPLLIQKIVAERLSDKMQLMMVPTDGRDFFVNDVLRGAFGGARPAPASSPLPAEPASTPARAAARRR